MLYLQKKYRSFSRKRHDNSALVDFQVFILLTKSLEFISRSVNLKDSHHNRGQFFVLI